MPAAHACPVRQRYGIRRPHDGGSVLEVTFAGEEHGNALLVGLTDRILVTDRTSGLYDGRHTIFGGQGHTVVEGEEAVRRQHKPLGESGGTGLLERDLG